MWFRILQYDRAISQILHDASRVEPANLKQRQSRHLRETSDIAKLNDGESALDINLAFSELIEELCYSKSWTSYCRKIGWHRGLPRSWSSVGRLGISERPLSTPLSNLALWKGLNNVHLFCWDDKLQSIILTTLYFGTTCCSNCLHVF